MSFVYTESEICGACCIVGLPSWHAALSLETLDLDLELIKCTVRKDLHTQSDPNALRILPITESRISVYI